MYKSVAHHVSIFDENELNYLIEESENVFESKTNVVTNSSWEQNVKQYSSPVFIKEIKKNTKTFNLVYNKLISLTGKKPASMYYHFCGPGCYLPWHNDGAYTAATTLYLNKGWDFRHGGLFQYALLNRLETIMPLANTGITQIGGVFHSTTIQSEDSPLRRTIQVWYFDKRELDKRDIL